MIQQVNRMGCGTLLAKMDIESTYWIIPVCPEDRPLLGVRWKGEFFYDLCLPFGLVSAPKIFTAVADALQWIFEKKGLSWVNHYLDDFIMVEAPESQECQANKEKMLAFCQQLGVSVVLEKCTDPAPVMVFLGFELDTINMVVRLPEEKLWCILAPVREWAGKKACKKRKLESLLGHLQHAATVVRPGRTFVRHIIELLSTAKARDCWIRLNAEIRADLYWWLHYMEKRNGVAMMPRDQWPGIRIETDASGSWGCGACWHTWWLQWKWDGRAKTELISTKELIPIVFAVAVHVGKALGRQNGRVPM